MNKIICPFCRDADIFPFEDKRLMKCGKCGLFINKHFLSKEAIRMACRRQMLSTCFAKNPGESRIKNANKQLDVLERYIKPGTVWDIASAAGFFMKAARDRGWEVHGNEISRRAIKWAKEHYNIDIEYGFLEDLEITAGYYNAVVLWNALEHMNNPKKTLEICWEMLKEYGLIYIRVPNKKTVKELIEYYEKLHLYEFTDECLARHLEEFGFKKIEIKPSRNSKSDIPHCDYLYKKIAK